MRKKLLLFLTILVFVLVFTSACSYIDEIPVFENESLSSNNSINGSFSTSTQEYMPVCGIDGITYPNKWSTGEINISHEGVCDCIDTKTNQSLSENEARVIANLDSECEDHLLENGFCNDVTGTWWFETDLVKKGCNPACVVNVATKEVEINWMCTGLLPINPPINHTCTDEEKSAKICTLEYAPVCGSDDVTYGNGCSACSNDLDYWVKGVC